MIMTNDVLMIMIMKHYQTLTDTVSVEKHCPSEEKEHGLSTFFQISVSKEPGFPCKENEAFYTSSSVLHLLQLRITKQVLFVVILCCA